MSDDRRRGERFRRLANDGVATRPSAGATADLFEHFGVDEAAGAAGPVDALAPTGLPEVVGARPCRRCTWLCTVVDGAPLPCPNCGLAPLLPPSDPDGA